MDDCSTDNTFNLAKNAGATVLRHIINRDQGAALRTGNDYAWQNGADIIVHFDADDQFVASEIKEIVKPIQQAQADIVFGSRFLEKKSKLPWAKEKIIMPIAKIVNKLFFNINLTDPQSGFRAFNRKTAQIILIEQDGKAHCSEILHKAFKNKLRIKEVPTTVIYHHFGQKFSGGLKIIKDLIINKLLD